MRRNSSAYFVGILGGVQHLITETVCFYKLSSDMTGVHGWEIALLFDALAFIPQLFIGVLSDKKNPKCMSITGFLLLSLTMIPGSGLFGLIAAALGNALIHIDLAALSLRCSGGKIAPCGIFVGGGSFGVVLGKILGSGKTNAAVLWIFVFAGIIISAFLPRLYKAPQSFVSWADTKTIKRPLILLCAFLTVAVRAYVAYAIPTGWNTGKAQMIALFVCMGIGKILGGFFADRFGLRKTSVISLLVSVPFLIFGNNNIWISLFGILLFSMTMTVSLKILLSVFPGEYGFSFGITTVGLFLGTLPAFFIRPKSLVSQGITVCILTLTAALCFAVCTDKKENII